MAACRVLLVVAALLLAAFPAAAQTANPGLGADLRVLDKITGSVTELVIPVGEDRQIGLLRVQLNECRYPAANPSGDAFASLTVSYRDDTTPVFAGWMIASAPALNAMDHPRYDVWVIRCTTS